MEKAEIALKLHILIFLLINLLLFIINLVIGGGWWFHYITAVWGIAILFQASLTRRKGV
ncbi:hypothetical protein DRP05_11795 [Archaeoglobales archaeon]|nr:MAG: hypothetical protein DRP05_11795 [Archaeoglobales archaeon]